MSWMGCGEILAHIYSPNRILRLPWDRDKKVAKCHKGIREKYSPLAAVIRRIRRFFYPFLKGPVSAGGREGDELPQE